MSEQDDIFPDHPTGGSDFDSKRAEEAKDVASTRNELNEQQRIGDAQQSPFAHNRVPVERKPG